MDPQHRLFLEVCWEAFENAGYDPAAYPGKVGVLAGSGGVVSTYLLSKLAPASLIDQTASTSHINNDKDFLSTRVSFKLQSEGAELHHSVRVLFVAARRPPGVPESSVSTNAT